MNTIYRLSGYVAVAVIAIVLTMLLCGKVKADENDRYIVILEQNVTYKVLATQVMYKDKADIINLTEWYLNGNKDLANRLFLSMIIQGRAIEVKHLNYLVIFESLHNGYTIYKVVG